MTSKQISRLCLLLPITSLLCSGASVGYQEVRVHTLSAQLHGVEQELQRLDPTGSSRDQDGDEIVVKDPAVQGK